jgi:DNA primase catalytic subunit
MRPATVQERERYYLHEFPIGKVKRWFAHWNSPVVFAIVIGRHTRIYPWEHRDKFRDTIVIDEYKGFSDVLEWLLKYRPESVYYDRNVYDSWEQARTRHDVSDLGRGYGQEMAFDIDPENFTCPIHGSLEQKMERHEGLSFCRLELQLARIQALELYELLSRRFSDIRIVYSGRGFHLHILDDNVLWWTRKKRLTFANALIRRGFVMDEWVTAGGIRMIRLPYSLNGLVSRIALPLEPSELESFDPLTDPRVIPNFLRGKA